jgi:hypothetical protein
MTEINLSAFYYFYNFKQRLTKITIYEKLNPITYGHGSCYLHVFM